MNIRITTCSLLGVSLGLMACAVPKAAVVAEAPAPKKVENAVDALVSEPPVPALPDDGLRLPDMFQLPKDGDFQATSPTPRNTDPSSGAVISRPPTDPPMRVKPKPAE